MNKKRGVKGQSVEMVIPQPLSTCVEIIESLAFTDITAGHLSSLTVKTDYQGENLYRFTMKFQKMFDKQRTYTLITEFHGTLQFDESYETTTIAGAVVYPFPTNDGLYFCAILLIALVLTGWLGGYNDLFSPHLLLGIAIISGWTFYQYSGQTWNTLNLIHLIQHQFEAKTQ